MEIYGKKQNFLIEIWNFLQKKKKTGRKISREFNFADAENSIISREFNLAEKSKPAKSVKKISSREN